MPGLLTRRQFVIAAGAVPLAAHAQSGRTIIQGQNFTGSRLPTDIGLEGGTAVYAKSVMTVRNCSFEGFGNGAIRVGSRGANDVVIEDCTGDNLYRFFENSPSESNYTPSPFTNFVIRRITARGLDRGMIQLKYTSGRGLIEDVIAYGSDRGVRYCTGFALTGEANDIVIRRCQAHRFIEATRPQYEYWNGDGFSDERTNSRIRYYWCVATDCTDGGFDTKSAGVYLADCTARGNKKNYRLWNTGTLVRCRSETPVLRGGEGGSAHFAFSGGEGSRYIIDRPVVRATPGSVSPVFAFETTAPIYVEIHNADIDAPGVPLLSVRGSEPEIRWIPARASQKIRVASERG